MGQPTPPSGAEVANELSTWAVGGGIITFALFPLALPIIALTAVALIPLAIPLVALALVGGLIAVPVVAWRWLWRRSGRRSSARRARGQERSALPTEP
jgi:uncharacterized membrane protein YbhN (UPF0104 family)